MNFSFVLVMYCFLTLLRLETEMRQLHQVISQLRNVRRSNQETVESALADRSAQQEALETQKREIASLRLELSDKIQSSEENKRLQAEVNPIHLHLADPFQF
jgi:cell shape-determining protein MreC